MDTHAIFMRGAAGFLTLAAAAFLSDINTSQAQLISYEGFNYAAGSSLAGASGGTGWATPWSSTGASLATNFSGSLSYGSLATSGGGVLVGNPVGTTGTTASMERDLPNTLGALAAANTAAPGTVWISLLYQNLGNNQAGLAGFREAKLGLFSGATVNGNGTANVNGTEKLDVGSPNTFAAGASDTLSLFSGSTFVSSGVATPRGTDPANTVFIVLEVTADQTTANDSVTAWFNPSLSLPPSPASGITFTTADVSSVNALRLQADNQNASGTNAVFDADELRVGDTFGDVAPVPEPTTLALLGMGGLATALVVRRKRGEQ